MKETYPPVTLNNRQEEGSYNEDIFSPKGSNNKIKFSFIKTILKPVYTYGFLNEAH